jgi:adenosylhomocysteine nucleosidase
MITLAIIAALDRELAPLVGDWQTRRFSHKGHNFRAYEHGDTIAVAGGVGSKAAGTTARAVVAQYHPQILVSAGVAGALQDDLPAGVVIAPKTVIDSATGAEYHSDCGAGTLVTAMEIADRKLKESLAARFHACAVDMEAAAVAEVASREGIRFRCMKAISDQADFAMPPLNEFVNDQGRFRTLKFVGWAALHPLRWADVAALARQTSRACNALCIRLREMSKSGP